MMAAYYGAGQLVSSSACQPDKLKY